MHAFRFLNDVGLGHRCWKGCFGLIFIDKAWVMLFPRLESAGKGVNRSGKA